MKLVNLTVQSTGALVALNPSHIVKVHQNIRYTHSAGGKPVYVIEEGCLILCVDDCYEDSGLVVKESFEHVLSVLSSLT